MNHKIGLMADEKTEIQSMLKCEFAKKHGIPFRTLARYMNELYFGELQIIDYKKKQKYLTPKQILFLKSKLVIK